MEQYSILGRIGEGAHGIVLKAKHIEVRVSVYITPDMLDNSGYYHMLLVMLLLHIYVMLVIIILLHFQLVLKVSF